MPAQGSGRGRGKVGGAALRGRGGGLAAIVGQLGKKNKLSTLEKSKLDWDRFKKAEGIEEDIQTHNKGKDGYVWQIVCNCSNFVVPLDIFHKFFIRWLFSYTMRWINHINLIHNSIETIKLHIMAMD